MGSQNLDVSGIEAEFPGAVLIDTQHGANEDAAISKIVSQLLERFPDTDIWYWKELGSFDALPRDVSSFRDFCRVTEGIDTEIALNELGFEGRIFNASPWRIELLALSADAEVKHREILTEYDDRIEFLEETGNPLTAKVLGDAKKSRVVNVEIEDFHFDSYLTSLSATLAREFTTTSMISGQGENAFLYYRQGLLRRQAASCLRDHLLSCKIAPNHFDNPHDLHIVPRGGFHSLYMPFAFKDKRIPYDTIQTVTEHLVFPSYLWVQRCISETDGDVLGGDDFSNSDQERLLLLQSMAFEFLQTAREKYERLLPRCLELSSETLEAWLESWNDGKKHYGQSIADSVAQLF